ncbi:MAG: DNA methyltransferase, partial [Patescibacteria group bacterium]
IIIDDHEVHHLRMIMDEIFGDENFVTELVWQKKTGASDSVTISTITEYILVYTKNNQLPENIFAKNKKSYDPERYSLSDEFVSERGKHYIDNLDRGGLQYSDSLNYPVSCPDGTITYPNGRTEYQKDGWIWKWSKQKLQWGIENKFIEFRKSKAKKSGWAVCYKNYMFVDNEGNKTERAAPLKNLITDILNADAASNIKDIFDSNIFQYTKPTELIKRVISFVEMKEDDIILDFFAGSGTTGQATLEQNSEDSQKCKFILVQLPEQTDIKSEAYKTGYKTLADVAKERIRRVIKGYGDNPTPISAGFKVFKLGQSNYVENQFEYDPEKSEEENQTAFSTYLAKAKQSSLFPKVNDLDVVYENIVKEGLSLNSTISQNKLDKNNVYQVKDGDRELLISLDAKLDKDTIKLLTGKEYKDKTFICLDNALDDTAKANLDLHLELKTI